jgi:peptidoglycan DL-endopeptidase CwlO
VLGRSLRMAVAAFVSLTVAFSVSTHAYAAPSPADIEKQIDDQWRVLEPVIEQYNGAVNDLKTSQAKEAALQAQLAPLQQQVDATMGRIGGLVVQAYKSGRIGSLNALLSGNSADDLGVNLAQLELIARHQRADISDVAATRDQYAKDERALQDLIATQQARETQLASQRKDIEAKISDLEKLRLQAYGTTGGGTSTGELKPVPCPASSGPNPGYQAAVTACNQIGKKYVYATAGPSTFDCSGLTMYAWASVGKSLAHQSGTQYKNTTRVSRSDLQVGDLIFYYGTPNPSHVGIYIGKINGVDWMVHASKPGVPIKEEKVDHGDSPSGYGRVK